MPSFIKQKNSKCINKSNTLRGKLTKEPANKQKSKHMSDKLIAENIILHSQETHEIPFLGKQKDTINRKKNYKERDTVK